MGLNDLDLGLQIERFWKLDDVSIQEASGNEKGHSVEHRRALQIMEESIIKEDGHYSIAVPFRQEVKSLPNNRVQAERRLACLAKKLERNPALKEAYVDVMRSLIEKQIVVNGTQVKKGAEWYIPHHPVVNENKKKTRIVFDCAAKHDGVGLNDAVLKGPDLTNGLLGVLLRFRQYPVAVTADVEAMFHQLK